MKWIALSVVLLGAAISILVLWLPPGSASVDLAGYDALRRARAGLPSTLGDIEGLAVQNGALGWQASVLAARARAALADFAAASEWLRRAVALRSTPALRAELAAMLEVSGARAEAKAEWENLLPKADAVQAMQRLEPDGARLAAVLVTAGKPADALPLVTPAKSDAARLTRARALLALGRTDEAVVEFAAYVAVRPDETAVRIEYGRAVERSGDSERALAIYRSAGAAGAYREGLLLESLGRLREAAVALQRSADGEALWRAARLLESLGDAPEALAIYEKLAVGTHRVRDDAALRAVVLLRAAGRVSEATSRAAMLPAAFQWILGSYVAPTWPAVPSVPNAAGGLLALADALVARGETDWATGELEFALEGADAATRIAIGQWYAERGDARRAFQIGSGLLASDVSRAAYELAYPRAHPVSVSKWAETYSVDPFLILAVIREESNYLATAVSSSNAGGLMQLLPSTAKWIAESKCQLAYTADLVFSPDANIRMGTWYLGYLTGYYKGDVARAVAAYNGGNGNVDRWTTAAKVAQRVDLPGALASIETREYLTKVLNAWLLYRALYTADLIP